MSTSPRATRSATGRRAVPTPGSTIATCVPTGTYGRAAHSESAPSPIAYLRTSWARSMTSASGQMPSTTALQIAADGSRRPKSVRSVTIGRVMAGDGSGPGAAVNAEATRGGGPRRFGRGVRHRRGGGRPTAPRWCSVRCAAPWCSEGTMGAVVRRFDDPSVGGAAGTCGRARLRRVHGSSRGSRGASLDSGRAGTDDRAADPGAGAHGAVGGRVPARPAGLPAGRPGGPRRRARGHRSDPRGDPRRRVAARRARRPGVRRDRLARARRDPAARPVARPASSRSSRAAGRRRCSPRSRPRTRGSSRCSRPGCSPGSVSRAGASARRRSAGGGSSSGAGWALGLCSSPGRRSGRRRWSTSWRSPTGPRSGRGSGPRTRRSRSPSARPRSPRARRRGSSSRWTARSTTGGPASCGSRGSATAPTSATRGTWRHGSRSGSAGMARDAGKAYELGPGRAWSSVTIDRAANHDLDRALVLEALTPDQRAVAEDHGLSFIEGARARHCRVPLEGDSTPALAAAGRRCSSARRTCRAGAATSTTGCSRTARSARWTDG